MSKEETVKLTINDKSLSFNIGIEDFNTFQNECNGQQVGMVEASHNFLARTVKAEDNDTLQDFLKNHPGAAIEICAAVVKEYKKPLNITVGK